MVKEKLNVLVVGSGGREHSIVQACLKSPRVATVAAAPGNGGIQMDATCHNVSVEDTAGIVALAKSHGFDFVIVGPEVPLSLGLVDALNEAGILAYGPNKAGAKLEASKAFTKSILQKYSIPTAGSETFTEIAPALAYLKTRSLPIVIKASGLAAGKGVIIAQTMEEAEDALREIMEERVFGDSGNEVLIEDFLDGEEASIHIMVSGTKYVMLPPSQDHKRVGENDTGLNTGGMGAYAPAALVTPELRKVVEAEVIEPTLQGLVSEGIDFRGTLYIGLMLTSEGPKVLEFNVRFGDPETQVLLPLLETDPIDLMVACADGSLEPAEIKVKDEYAMVVVLTARGYPEAYQKGDIITFPADLPENTQIVHAGTVMNESGEILTAGGRVLGVTAYGKTLEEARDAAYKVVDQVHFNGMNFRRDIGAKELRRRK